MNFLDQIKKQTAISLPTVTLGGDTFYVRKPSDMETFDLVEDCAAFARAVTSDKLKGQSPNNAKVQFVRSALDSKVKDREGNERENGIKNIIGEVDYNDAFAVALSHAMIICFGAMKAARLLLNEDGNEAMTLEDRIEFCKYAIENPAILNPIQAIIDAPKEATEGNDKPEALQD